MAVPSSIQSGVGFRNCQILALDSNGIIYASGSTAYSGLNISGAKSLTINDPEPRQIVHIGDDRPFALDVLPPTEPMTGELNVSKTNNTVDTILQNVNEVTLGEAKLYAIGSDQRGNENQVCLLAYRQAVDDDPASTTYGKRLWQFRLFPKCYLVPRENNYDDNAEARVYTVRPQFATAYPWGVQYSSGSGSEGCLMAQGLRGIAEGKPKIIAFDTDNSVTSFSLPVAAKSTAKISAFTVTTAGVGTVSTPTTKTTAAVQYTTAPTTGKLIVFYET